MSSKGWAPVQWTIVASVLVGAAFFALAGMSMMADAVIGQGSHEGNILRVGLGILSFFVGLFLLVVATLSWKSPNHRSTSGL